MEDRNLAPSEEESVAVTLHTTYWRNEFSPGLSSTLNTPKPNNISETARGPSTMVKRENSDFVQKSRSFIPQLELEGQGMTGEVFHWTLFW